MTQNKKIVRDFIKNSYDHMGLKLEAIVSPSFSFSTNGSKPTNSRKFLENIAAMSKDNKIVFGDLKTANQINYFSDVQIYNQLNEKALAICRFTLKGGMISLIELNYHPILGDLDQFNANFCMVKQ